MSNLPHDYPQAKAPFVMHVPRPYRCPICGGRGHVPHDFYRGLGMATATNPVRCKACGGRGIVIA